MCGFITWLKKGAVQKVKIKDFLDSPLTNLLMKRRQKGEKSLLKWKEILLSEVEFNKYLRID